MSEQETSDELKAAAQRVAESIELAVSGVGEGDAIEMTYNGGIYGLTRDMTRLAVSTLERLDAEESERAERAKPIDAEWLESIGFDFNGLRLRRLLSIGHYELSASPHADDMLLMQDDDAIAIPHITTRGQLLDLLAALKGGA